MGVAPVGVAVEAAGREDHPAIGAQRSAVDNHTDDPPVFHKEFVKRGVEPDRDVAGAEPGEQSGRQRPTARDVLAADRHAADSQPQQLRSGDGALGFAGDQIQPAIRATADWHRERRGHGRWS
ncbi:MAG: hypothetical protein V9G10_11945 [Candidatus Nanopelagicales bacterium]